MAGVFVPTEENTSSQQHHRLQLLQVSWQCIVAGLRSICFSHGYLGRYLVRNIYGYEYSIAGNVVFQRTLVVFRQQYCLQGVFHYCMDKCHLHNKDSWYCARCPLNYHQHSQRGKVRCALTFPSLALAS